MDGYNLDVHEWVYLFLSKMKDRCYLCDGTGFVPYLNEPDFKSSVYYISNMACKCSEGYKQALPFKRYPLEKKPSLHVNQYFKNNKEVQFTEVIEHMSYPQLVNTKKNELNRDLTKGEIE